MKSLLRTLIHDKKLKVDLLFQVWTKKKTNQNAGAVPPTAVLAKWPPILRKSRTPRTQPTILRFPLLQESPVGYVLYFSDERQMMESMTQNVLNHQLISVPRGMVSSNQQL